MLYMQIIYVRSGIHTEHITDKLCERNVEFLTSNLVVHKVNFSSLKG
jgi:hypothetical protein